MASTQKLQIIIDAENRANGAINEVNTRLGSLSKSAESLKPVFQKMALAGTIAFGAIASASTIAVKEAANAQGAYAKFNTVFAEHSEDMLSFIEDIRSEMPTATHEIVRMAADLQDLLIPMGLTRESATKMTKGFIDLSNKLAAFNDVDPTEVLEAFRSGLSGSSEPLRRFGINALDSSIELEALETGLLNTGEKLSSLDAVTRSQVKAQALLTLSVKQSGDAISGFAANNDSLVRRTQDLNAKLAEMRVAIGTALIPVAEKLVAVLKPIVEKILQWSEQNPLLVERIVLIGGAIAGLLVALGSLGLVLPVIITGITLMGTALAFVAANPLVVIMAGLVLLVTKFNELIKVTGGFSEAMIAMGDTIVDWWKNSGQWIYDKIKMLFDMYTKAIDAAGRLSNSISQKISSVTGIGNSARAAGGPVTAGKPYLVGENGPEMFTPNTYGRINNNPSTGGVVINISGNSFMGKEGVAEEIGDAIMQQLQYRMKLSY